MTEIINPIVPTTDTWSDLVDRLNVVIDKMANTVVSTGQAVTGNVSVTGNISATGVYDNGVRVVNVNRSIDTLDGIQGGGNFSTNLTLRLDPLILASAALADSSVQPTDMNGQIAFTPQRMTTPERDAISPQAGRMIYNTTANKIQWWDGTTWINMS